MRIDILTLFPDMITNALSHSIIKRAMDNKLVEVVVTDIRSFTTDRHRTADDTPYGGGGGMIMKVEPIFLALKSIGAISQDENGSDCGIIIRFPVILTDPRGDTFDQQTARKWAGEERIVLICGHYEGVDERVRKNLVTHEVSIGDYILTGGELPALVVTDAITRLQAGALGDENAPDRDSFADNLLEYPHYTRPAEFNGWKVPMILQSGNHACIDLWRRWNQLQITRERRPDLLDQTGLSDVDKLLLNGSEPEAPILIKTGKLKKEEL